MERRDLLAGTVAVLAARPGIAATPPPSTATLARVAFASCADQGQPQPIWSAIHAYRPELFLFTGDNVYGDVSSGEMLELRAAYATAAEIPGFARLRREIPLLAIWDDHDYGANDAGIEFPWKQASKELFLAFWDVPASDPRRSRDGLHHAVTFGPPGRRIQVILLDTRWFRSPLKRTDRRGTPGRERYVPDVDPTKTMLGEEQWRWLEARLREPAELRLVVSSIQVLADGHGWERWGNFPRERQRLYDLVASTGANGVLFLSGDRHIGAFYRETSETPYPLIEATSSGINKSYRSPEPGPNRLGAIVGEPNFGTLDVDWTAGRAVVALRGGDGVPRASLDLDIPTMRVP